MKWKAISFENIQSWEQGTIELNEKGLTVIEAKSETGKSVFIKCIRLGLFFETYDKKTRLAIIRNYPKNKYGIFTVMLEDGTKVGFKYGETNVICVVVYPDKTHEIICRKDIKKVAELLNLVTVKDSVRVLNILDNETPMLYDTTDMEYNTNVMSLYLDHEDLRNRKKNCEEFLSRIRLAESRTKNLYENYIIDYERVNIKCDVDKVNKLYKKADNINNVLNTLEILNDEIRNIECYKYKNTYNMDNSDKVFSYLTFLENFNIELSHLLNTMSNKRKTCKDTYFDNIQRIKQHLDYYTMLNNNLCTLQDTMNNKKIVNLNNIVQLKDKIEMLKKVNSALGFLFNSIVDANKAEQLYSGSKEALNIFKEQNKTCPLCGQLWGSEQE